MQGIVEPLRYEMAVNSSTGDGNTYCHQNASKMLICAILQFTTSLGDVRNLICMTSRNISQKGLVLGLQGVSKNGYHMTNPNFRFGMHLFSIFQC